MKYLGVIPARYASSRFPGKPLAMIGEKTMIQRVYDQASKVLENLLVATDDERIANEVRAFGGQVVMTSAHHQSGTDRCAEAAQWFVNQLNADKNEDWIVINIQGDEPFIEPEQLRLLMDCFGQESTQIATLVKQIDKEETLFNPNNPKVVRGTDGRALYFSRAAIPPLRGRAQEEWLGQHIYYKHIGMYAYRYEVLLQITRLPVSVLEQAESLEQLRWLEHGYLVQTAETQTETLSIDTPEDLQKALEALNG